MRAINAAMPHVPATCYPYPPMGYITSCIVFSERPPHLQVCGAAAVRRRGRRRTRHHPAPLSDELRGVRVCAVRKRAGVIQLGPRSNTTWCLLHERRANMRPGLRFAEAHVHARRAGHRVCGSQVYTESHAVHTINSTPPLSHLAGHCEFVGDVGRPQGVALVQDHAQPVYLWT